MVQLWRCEQIPSPPNPKSPPRFGGSTNQNPGLVAGEDDPGPAQPGFWDGGLGFWGVPPVCSFCGGGKGRAAWDGCMIAARNESGRETGACQASWAEISHVHLGCLARVRLSRG